MECVGFKKPVIKWFKSYFSNRKFFVSVEGVFSEERLLTCGVPQGSILGPVLFIIYINNLPQSLIETASNLYADDTCIYHQYRDIQEIENVLNKEFSSLCEWFIDNKLSIHFGEDQTKAILFTRNKTEAKSFSRSFHQTIQLCTLDTLVVSLITTYVENQWPEKLSKR